MFCLSSNCFMCLQTHNLQELLLNNTENAILEQIAVVFPEKVAILQQLETTVQICCACRITLQSFCTFKQMCLNNFDNLKQYIKPLQNTPNYENATNNIGLQIKQEKEDTEDELLSEVEEMIPNKIVEITIKEEFTLDDNADEKCSQTQEDSNIFSESSENQNDTDSNEPKNIDSDITYFKCLVCNKNFTTKQKFKRHKKAHEDLKNYECMVCNRKFTKNSQLVKHIKNHEGIKDYECNICQKSEDEECSSTPPEVAETTNNASSALLPAKSKILYEAVYNRYKEWCTEKKVGRTTENVLLAYFSKRCTQIKPSSLWSEYSMIKTCVLSKENIRIKSFTKLTAFLKRQSVGYKARKFKILGREQINKFLEEAPNSKYLMMKAALIFGIAGTCRREELKNITLDDITYKGDIIIVKIPETKNYKERSFVIGNDEDYKNIDIRTFIREYAALRPSNTNHKRFFINYRDGKCGPQPVGVNTFGAIPSNIAKFLGLEDAKAYTGHSLRRSSSTLLADEGGNIPSLKRHGIEGNVEDSLGNKTKIAKTIMQQ